MCSDPQLAEILAQAGEVKLALEQNRRDFYREMACGDMLHDLFDLTDDWRETEALIGTHEERVRFLEAQQQELFWKSSLLFAGVHPDKKW